MLNEAILVLTAFACMVGLSVAVWSFATAGKRQEARLRKRKGVVGN